MLRFVAVPLFYICLCWPGPRPHIGFPLRPHFVCKFCRHGDNLSFLRHRSQSITILIVAQLRPIDLHNVSGQIPRCKDKIPKQIFPEKEFRGLSPNFHIHVSVSDLYIPTIGLYILLEEICKPILGIYKSLTDT
jgi:hypothetical protein